MKTKIKNRHQKHDIFTCFHFETKLDQLKTTERKIRLLNKYKPFFGKDYRSKNLIFHPLLNK